VVSVVAIVVVVVMAVATAVATTVAKAVVVITDTNQLLQTICLSHAIA
jgi:hypothetical protein